MAHIHGCQDFELDHLSYEPNINGLPRNRWNEDIILQKQKNFSTLIEKICIYI
eukprot:UN02888